MEKFFFLFILVREKSREYSIGDENRWGYYPPFMVGFLVGWLLSNKQPLPT